MYVHKSIYLSFSAEKELIMYTGEFQGQMEGPHNCFTPNQTYGTIQSNPGCVLNVPTLAVTMYGRTWQGEDFKELFLPSITQLISNNNKE